MKKNTGKEYEDFVGAVQQALINASGISHVKNISVETNKKIEDKNGIVRQFDVYWEFDLGGVDYKTVVECKDYASPVSIEKIEAFISKVSDIPWLIPIYATKSGYQSGAKIKAEKHNVKLLVIKRPEDFDWTNSNGDPLIKTINLNIEVVTPPIIKSFKPLIDENWLNEHPDINIEEIALANKRILNDRVFILDEATGSRISVSELADTLPSKIKGMQYGEGAYREMLPHAYIELGGNNIKLKLAGFELTYIYHEPVRNTSIIDLSEQLLGIVRDYISGDQKMVFKDGRVT